MSRARNGAAAKTDNEKYVRRGADLVIEYNPEWEGDVRRANEGKVGAPYQYAETLVMMAAALRSALGVKYRQLEGMSGGWQAGPTPPRTASCTSGSPGLTRT